MNALHEYALLVAIAIPFLVVVGLNIFLFFGEERGTLLLPSGRAFEAPAYPESPAKVETPDVASEAANDDFERRVA